MTSRPRTAISAGLAGGADVILLPEIPYSEDGIIEKLKSLAARGQQHALMVVAEGVKSVGSVGPLGEGNSPASNGIGNHLGEVLSRRLDTDVRVTVLGHVQRGGSPCAQDRILAQTFGTRAVDLAAQGKFGCMVAWRERGVIDVPLKEVVAFGDRKVLTNGTYVKTARALGIYVGEDQTPMGTERIS